MTHREIAVDPRVLELYPDFRLLVLTADGLANGPSNAASIGGLRDAEGVARTAFGDDPPTSHPHVQAWRAAYSKFGAKPSKYFSSVESLLRRVLRGEQVPAVNRAVDVYNAVSLRHVVPAGGEDGNSLVGQLRLFVADGTEDFDVAEADDGEVEHPAVGEVVWGDDHGVTCRRWNWRQGRRTRLTETSTSAVFVLERLAPFPEEALHAAGDELRRALAALSPQARFSSHALPRESIG